MSAPLTLGHEFLAGAFRENGRCYYWIGGQEQVCRRSREDHEPASEKQRCRDGFDCKDHPECSERKFTSMTMWEAEGAHVGLVSCLKCGAALIIDERDYGVDVQEIHEDWHRSLWAAEQ